MDAVEHQVRCNMKGSAEGQKFDASTDKYCNPDQLIYCQISQ